MKLKSGKTKWLKAELLKKNKIMFEPLTLISYIQFLKNLSKEDFNININSRKRFERTQQVINLQNIFYEVTKP